MEDESPQTTSEVTGHREGDVTSPQPKWYTPLTRVTPLSKALAMALFILLPFVGFVVGVGYGNSLSEEYVSTSKSSEAERRHEICDTYNTGGRKGACANGAPEYCAVVYYPPSCPTCQDGAGCGYPDFRHKSGRKEYEDLQFQKPSTSLRM